MIYDLKNFPALHKAGKLAADVLVYIEEYVTDGISTEEINQLCHNYITDHGAIPAPLGYHGYPKSVCTSVNHVICHGIPSSEKILQSGDIINIDVTVILDGWYGDTSKTFCVGEVGIKAKRLIKTTYECMMLGIEQSVVGHTLGDIGFAIQEHAHDQYFSVVRDYTGHGTGRVFHEEPTILHFGQPGAGDIIQEGMVFTIEPMLNTGTWKGRILKDGWTVVTVDHGLSAQFEHTIGITKNGPVIFTLP